MDKVTVAIEGMTCEQCASNIQNSLKNLTGVNTVTVSLQDKKAVVEGNNIDTNQIMKQIDSLGYDAKPSASN